MEYTYDSDYGWNEAISKSIGKIRLEPHPVARSKATAALHFRAGSTLVSVSSLTTTLSPSQKGSRCDACFRMPSNPTLLRKCTGCASYWYCDTQCQLMQWNAHHKKICKTYNYFISSDAFQALAPHNKLDAFLLTHLLAQITLTRPSLDEKSSPTAIFLSLLPGPNLDPVPPIPPLNPPTSLNLVKRLYSRFNNNNFAVQSHFNTVGYGIFPLASRLFNHSCVPNAVAKYIFSHATPVTMEVIALRDIGPGEEICIPYLDPALVRSRRQMLKLSYGFECTCSSCDWMKRLGDISPPTVKSDMLDSVAKILRMFVGIDQPLLDELPNKSQESVPSAIHCIFHETYLSNLSEAFSKSSHEGQYDLALDSGITLLALYTILYPSNYPQIGMHLLELAKTTWNMFISSTEMTMQAEQAIKEQAQVFLSLGCKVLNVFGPEGDEEGPLKEVETLQSLLNS